MQLNPATLFRPYPNIRVLFGNSLSDDDYAALAQQTRTQKDGHGPDGRISFALETAHILTDADACKIQKKIGYAPEGYDFLAFKKINAPNNQFRYTWQCSASCD